MKNKRILTIGFLVCLAWLFMGWSVFYVQIVKNKQYTSMAYNQSVRRNIITPKRGEILDVNGNSLVMNAEVDVEFKENGKVKQRKLKRITTHGPLLGQVLGNISQDGYGQLGLEYSQDKTLRGIDGFQFARYDVNRKYHPSFEEDKKNPVNGDNIVVTIDIEVQRAAEQALELGIKRVGAINGVAIVIEPSTGDVLAMANYPLYNPNRRSMQDIEGWKNSAISKIYEPGSTFKIITAASVLEEDKMDPQTKIYGEGGETVINGAKIVDTHPSEWMTYTEAMAYSSNIAMVKSTLKLSPEKVYQYIRSFGFGIKTGIDLPAEESGSFKKIENWSGRTQLTLAFGLEISVTPLQLAMAVSAIANDGVLMKPRIIKEKRSSDGVTIESYEPRMVRRVVSSSTASEVRQMLATVVEYGTAKNIKTDRYSIAGKTGTAEKIDEQTGRYGKGKFHSSFIGMVPADAPKYVCLVLVNEPKTDKHGGSSAAPIFKQIMDRIVTIRGENFMKPDNLEPSLSAKKEDADKSAAPPRPKIKVASTSILSFLDHKNSTNQSVAETDDTQPIYINDMPDLTNMSLRDAIEKLKNLNLKIEYKGMGKVFDQSPKPLTKVKTGETCTLTLNLPG